jgi:hypothetical protein
MAEREMVKIHPVHGFPSAPYEPDKHGVVICHPVFYMAEREAAPDHP